MQIVKITVASSISMDIPRKIKNRTIIWSNNSTSGYLSEESKNTYLRRYLHGPIQCSITYNSQYKKTT